MSFIKANLKSIIILFLILVGIVVGVYLVQVKHIFKSRAFTDVNEAFEVTDDQGNSLQDKCGGDRCEVESLRVNIKIKDIPALLKR